MNYGYAYCRHVRWNPMNVIGPYRLYPALSPLVSLPVHEQP